jgi:DeoR/GlpR family transcriptional regulator of sugar metabolism
MLAEERRQKLAETVSKLGYAPLPELVRLTGVSESTIRRDLEHLHEAGRLRRTHGGAMASGNEPPLPALEDRAERQAREKRAIAREMAERIRDGETVLIDGGTTTLELARLLVGRSLQVITNSLPIAHLFGSTRTAELVLIGGYVYPKTGVALGPMAIDALRRLHVNRLVLSCAGATERGLFNGNLLLVETQRAMIEAADETSVLADSSKFGRAALTFLGDWSRIRRVVTDPGLSDEQRRMIGPGVEIRIAGDHPPMNGAEPLEAAGVGARSEERD